MVVSPSEQMPPGLWRWVDATYDSPKLPSGFTRAVNKCARQNLDRDSSYELNA